MIVTPNEYLDARRAEWLDDELLGHVRYEKETRTVIIMAQARRILEALRETPR